MSTLETNHNYNDYTINLKSHLRLLENSLWYFGSYLIGMICIWFIKFNNYEIWFWSLTTLMLIFLVPALYLHYCYNEYAANVSIRVYEKHIEIYKNEELIFLIDEGNIISIEIFMCNGLINYDYTNALPIEDYNYLKFITNKEEIIVNNLIHPNIKLLAARFTNIKPVYYPTLFALP